jgi:hypothetical protein
MNETIYSWKPSLTQARLDNGRLARATRQSILAAVESLASSQSNDFASALTRVAIAAGGQPDSLCHPDLFYWYFQLKDSVASSDFSAREALQRLKRIPAQISSSAARARSCGRRYGLAVDVDDSGCGVQETLRNGERYVQRLTHTSVNLKAVPRLAPELSRRLRDAIALIKSVWPKALAEFPLFVRRMVVYRGHAAIGFTDFRYHGSIFFKHEHLMSHPAITGVAEDLIHEAAHVRLNALMAVQPLFTNDDRAIYPSPLRKDLRSMYGLFHQMFVLARTSELYRRIGDITTFDCRKDFCKSMEGMNFALATVSKHARLTAAGSQITESIRRLSNELETPAPRQFEAAFATGFRNLAAYSL